MQRMQQIQIQLKYEWFTSDDKEDNLVQFKKQIKTVYKAARDVSDVPNFKCPICKGTAAKKLTFFINKYGMADYYKCLKCNNKIPISGYFP